MRLGCLLLILLTFSLEGISQKYLLKEDVNKDTLVPKFGFRRKFDLGNYSGYGFVAGSNTNIPPSNIQYFNSWQFREGIWGRVKLNKWYALGGFVEYARDAYRLKNPLIIDTFNNPKNVWTKQVNNNIVFGIFNRINLKKDRVYFDVGGYFAYDFLPRILQKSKQPNGNFQHKKTTYTKPTFMNQVNYGIDLRLTYGKLSLYSRYRITGLYKNEDYDLPKMMIGIVVDYKN